MPKVKEVPVPDLGGFEEVDVIEVHISKGDTVKKEDPLITLESDKAAMDVPAPFGGSVVSVAVGTGDKVSQGDTICELKTTAKAQKETEGESDSPQAEPRQEKSQEEPQPEKSPQKEPPQTPPPQKEPPQKPPPQKEPPQEKPPQKEPPQKKEPLHTGPIHASPATRRLAREKNVDLARVTGSGRKGRITKKDVETAAQHARRAAAEAEKAERGVSRSPLMGAQVEDFAPYGEVSEKPLSRVQKRGAKNLAASWPQVPQVTQHEEADVTALELFRRELASEAEARDVHLTLLAFVMKATVAALQRYPRFNASLGDGGETVIEKHYFHLSVAVDTEQGLVVPVIQDVDRKGVFALAAELMDKSERARRGKLKLDEVKGGNFSITNLGGIGGTAFTPIVYAPQVAVLGLSRARTRPVWRKAEERFVERRILPLSLSYDHRVIDGARAARFVVYLADLLGDVRRFVL
jgi:pyruvate dehydrogenase E2 component (dihydrolipoamide acetyltransferase)